jgi:hypothetical protein
MRVSKICVRQIRVNQRLGVHNSIQEGWKKSDKSLPRVLQNGIENIPKLKQPELLCLSYFAQTFQICFIFAINWGC